jgi:3-deoxy-D-arabino-heptulosonate 7-phosphate (DAHP) synthase class II
MTDFRKIFADENVPGIVVSSLRTAGHDVTWGCEFDVGATDAERLLVATHEDRIILTEDKDFAELVIAKGFMAHGVIRFDLFGMSRERKPARILDAMNEIFTGSTVGRLFVIEPARIRSKQIV